MKKIFLTILMLLPLSGLAMDRTFDIDYSFMTGPVNTYRGTIIDESSLADLASLPENKDVVQKWIKNNKSALEQIVLMKWNFSKMLNKARANRATMFSLGCDELSKDNHIFRCPADKNSILKISGSVHRACQAKAAVGKFNDKGTPIDDFAKVKSYQTASRAATYLRLKEYQDIYCPQGLLFAETYITCLNPEGGIDDDNAIVIAEWEPTPATTVRDKFDVLELVSNKTTQEFIGAIAYAGLWDIHPNVEVTDDGCIKYVDYEQPKDENPHYFFRKNRDNNEGHMNCGLGQFAKLCQKADDLNKLEIIKREISKMPMAGNRQAIMLKSTQARIDTLT